MKRSNRPSKPWWWNKTKSTESRDFSWQQSALTSFSASSRNQSREATWNTLKNWWVHSKLFFKLNSKSALKLSPIYIDTHGIGTNNGANDAQRAVLATANNQSTWKVGIVPSDRKWIEPGGDLCDDSALSGSKCQLRRPFFRFWFRAVRIHWIGK